MLILAVEPDGRQAVNLEKVLRARPKTDVVIADSAVRALETLADKVPDMLLVSPLVSRQDEAVLANWLRDLGPAAARMQQLTIPILAASAPMPSSVEEDPWVPIVLEDAVEEPAAKAPVTNPRAKPAQDEWGFFDPDQCGFAALLTKLDEVTEDKDKRKKSAKTTVRVVTY